jgi:hypothetical protein
MFVTVEVLYTLASRELKKEKQSKIVKCITSLWVEDITICTEIC